VMRGGEVKMSGHGVGEGERSGLERWVAVTRRGGGAIKEISLGGGERSGERY